MAANDIPNESTRNISIADLEYALKLLKAEEIDNPKLGLLFQQIIIFLTVWIFIIACPLGILAIWSDKSIGITFLVTAVISFVILLILTFSGKITDPDSLFSQLPDINIGKIAERSFEKQNTIFLLMGIIGLMGVGCLWGTIWLIIDLVNIGHMTAIPIILIWACVFCMSILTAIYEFKRYAFYSQVIKALGRFEQVKKIAMEQQEGQVTLSAPDLELLSQVETKKAKRSIAQMQSNVQNWFAILISPRARESLNELKQKEPDEYDKIRNAIDAMQEEPRPPAARVLPNQPGYYKIRFSKKHQIVYKLDEKEQRIEIIEIRDNGNREAHDAS